MASHLSWFGDVIVMDGSYAYIPLDNKWPAKQQGGRLVIEEVQTQLCKNKQDTKDKQGTKDKQKTEDEKETEEKQKGKEIGLGKANKSDEASKFNELDCLFVPIVYVWC